MKSRMTKWLALSLVLAFVALTSCAEEPAAENGEEEDNNLPTNQDVQAPLEDLDTLMEGAPDNATLPEVAKHDEQFEAQFDVVDTQSPVRSQGGRGVCSVFSTVGLMEHLYIKEGTITDPDFSEQYLQWAVKTDDLSIQSFQDSSGSNANYNLQAISRYGIPEESAWPYQSSPWSSSDDEACSGDSQPYFCYTNGAPPEDALNAAKYQLPDGKWTSTRVRDIKAHINHHETGVVVGGPFYYQSWNHSASSLPTNQEYWRNGYVLYPNAADKEAAEENPAGHSILLVGWDDDLEVERLDGEGNVIVDEDGNPETEKGFFIFKNSWGTGSFGVDNPHGDGYGYISYEYVQQYKSGRVAAMPEPQHIPDAGPECTQDNQCSSDQICESEECVTPECIVDNDCTNGDICEANECVLDGCDYDNPDCGDPHCLDAPVCEGQLETFESDGEIVVIPDNDETGVTSSIEVAGSGLIQDLELDVYIDHTWNGDVQIDLIHPSGDRVTIREADGNSGEDIYETFSTDAFDLMESEGTWQLQVTDNADQDEGELLAWDLHIVR